MDPWLAMMAWIHAVNPPLDGFISIGFDLINMAMNKKNMFI